MKLIYGKLFNPSSYLIKDENKKLTKLSIKPDALVITTNKFVKNNGEAVMGRGCAKEAATKYPEIKKVLGNFNKKDNNVNYWNPPGESDLPIVFFHVKPAKQVCNKTKSNVVLHMSNRFQPGNIVPGWACLASISLIEKSAFELVKLVDKMGWSKVVIPRTGCGAGELRWIDVQPVLNQYLDDRFYCITFSP